MAKKIDTLERIHDKISHNGYLGFTPTSNSTKPPHIANGLFRSCAGEICDTRDVNKWIVGEGRKKAVSTEDLIDEYEEIIEPDFRDDIKGVKAFRFLLGELFNQDNTAYGDYDYSVMTQSSHWLIKSRVNPEANIGNFLFEILAKEIDGKRSPAIAEIKKALDNDTDDLTKLIKPIISFQSEKEKRETFGIDYPDDKQIHWDKCKETIRKGFDLLTKNLKFTGETKNSLVVLQRYVNFSIFSTFLYLTQANAAVFEGRCPPIVIDSGAGFESVQRASEQSYTAAKKAVEEYYINAIARILNEDEEIKDNDKACQQWIEEMIISTNEESIRYAVSSYYESFRTETESPVYALAKALQIVLYTLRYNANTPSDFCRVLGVRCGLVGPKGNRATIKRYLVNSFTIATLVLSVIDFEEAKHGIELKEMSDLLVRSYNIIFGANPEKDYEDLENANIAQSTPGDLRGDLSSNAVYLASTLISLGFAKSYADGVTMIGWRL